MIRASPPYLADFDSATAMVRALARHLRGEGFSDLGLAPVLRPVALAANRLPLALRALVYAWGGRMEAGPPRGVDAVKAEDISRWVVDAYPARRYPAVMIGSSNGAMVHLGAALGIPWLPQTYLIAIRRPLADPDDLRRSVDEALPLGRAILKANPELHLHHMHDPNQDRLMSRGMTYFRIKRRRLGPIFEGFLADALEPGGTIFVVECRHAWPVTRIDDRYWFQAGGVGGATPQEYLDGGPRVAAFLAREGSSWRRWEPPRADARAPEAEWGFEPTLLEDIERFARRHGQRVVRVEFDEPEAPSPLVADLYRWWYARRGLPADRLIVDSFILMDPWWTLRLGAVPFWTKFPVEPSAATLEAYLDAGPPFDHIGLMLFSHGVRSLGFAPIERWRSVLGRARVEGRFLGVSERAYPADFAAFARYHGAVRTIPSRCPMAEPLTPEQLAAFLSETSARYAVEWRGLSGRREIPRAGVAQAGVF